MDAKYKMVETTGEFIDAIRLRVDVFIREQGFQPGWEPDEDDKKAVHYIAIAGGKIVATARVREVSGMKIERMAVQKEYRRKGIGKDLTSFIIADLAKRKPKRIWLQSQLQAQKFYEKCGFKTVSKPVDMWGMPHVDMEYSDQPLFP